MRISDWSSDVCSSDLTLRAREYRGCHTHRFRRSAKNQHRCRTRACGKYGARPFSVCPAPPTRDAAPNVASRRRYDQASASDRKSVVWGKSVSVRVDLGGRRIIKKKKQIKRQKK